MSWWELKSVADLNRVERAQYYALPPDACFCGTPLEVGWHTEPGGGKMMHRKCPMGPPPAHIDWIGGERPI